jgi:RNA polymerase sigma-70 factor (ECF subfamily)
MRRNFIPDQTLTDQLYHGDADAFEELYSRHWYSLYSYSFGKLKSHSDAKRIVTNVFVSLWEKRTELPITFSLSAYLYAQVRNEVVKCVNAKMNNEEESSFIEQQIIPGFASQELAKAKQPVSYKDVYPKPGRLHLSEMAETPKETLWDKYYSRNSFKGIKHALQTMLNF